MEVGTFENTAKESGATAKGPGGGGPRNQTFLYFYHPDHLGSSSYITDALGEVSQHVEYFAFGETFFEEHSNTERTPYLFNGKELDEETGLYYYGARYYDPVTSVWQSVDPLAEKYPNVSPYAYAINNPLIVIDPDGRDIIVLSMGGAELRRITTNGPDRYIKVNRDAFFKANNSFVKDNRDYNTMLSVWSLRNQERRTKQTDLIAEQVGVSIIGTGEIREDNNLIGDIDLAINIDFDDQSSYSTGTYEGVAGGFGNGAPENGDYTVDTYRNREPGNGDYNAGMNSDGVGFSFNLDPTFDTNRSLLRIHPDGNNEGTLGCLGLSGNAESLNSFRSTINGYLELYSSIPLNLQITNNPNNNGTNGNTIPNVNE